MKSPYGNFALQPGDGRTISEDQLRLKGVDGLTIRARVSWINKAGGKRDWSFVDASIKRCENTGKAFTLLLMGGNTSQPWNSAAVGVYVDLAAAMGTRYSKHPLLAGPHVTGGSPSGVSEELHWSRPMPAAAISLNKRLIDVWDAAFPDHPKLLAISGKDAAAMRQLIAYGGDRLLVKNNSMKASTTLTADHNALVVEAGKKGAEIGWEMVGSTKESRFGGTLQTAFKHMDTLTAQAGKAKRQSYRAIYMPDLGMLGGIK